MLDVLDCIDETGIDLELVKETFDKRIAPVKAWAARMELDAKHDRFMMGFAGRLASGKALNHPPPYGYSRDEEGYYQLDEEEAEWIEKLYVWYADGISMREIRRRLVSSGAKPRNDTQYPWHIAMLRKMLRAEYYWTGKHKVKWDGEVYEIPMPVIITEDLAQRVIERKSQYKQYPAGNLRNDVLAAGLLYCAIHNTRCNVCSSNNGVKKDGTPKKYIYYMCNAVANLEMGSCFCRCSVKKIDSQVWDKVWNLISRPGAFEEALQLRIGQLQAEEVDAQAESERLARELDNLLLERQRVITWARKGTISEDDLETQLLTLSWQESSLRRDLADMQLLLGNRAEKLIELAGLFRERVKAGVEGLKERPSTREEEQLQFELKRKIVQAIVKRVDIHHDRSITVKAEIELPEGDPFNEKFVIGEPMTSSPLDPVPADE